MAITKPGTTKGNYIWTGYKWVKKAERTADKVTQQKLLEKEKQRYYAGTDYKTDRRGGNTPLASYPGPRVPQSKATTSTTSTTPSTSKPSSAAYNIARRAGRGVPSKTKPPATTAGSTSGKGSGRNGSGKKPPPRRTVLQQNTMWVTAKESKTGKGYLAQKGKPEKRVTARVKIQEATTSGKAAGSTYLYKSGKTIKKVGKK